jgi:hypothetical protein
MATITNTALLMGQAGILTGTTYSGQIIDTIWSAKILQHFYEKTIYNEIANTDYEGEIKNHGDTVRINKEPLVTINDYVPGAGFVDAIPPRETIDLTIDRAKYFAIPVFDVVEHQSFLNNVNMYSASAAENLKIAINTDVMVGTVGRPGIFNDIDPINIGPTAGIKTGAYDLGSATAPLDLSTEDLLSIILRLAAVLDEQCIPETDRWLLLDSASRVRLLGTNIIQAQMMGDPTSPIRNGKIGRIDRFDTYVTNTTPMAAAGQDYWGNVSGGALAHRVIMAGHKSALTFASQITRSETKDMPNDFGKRLCGLSVYGFKVLRPDALTAAYVC